MLSATEEEQRLLDLLEPKWWKEESAGRGVRGVSLKGAELTESGVVATLSLDGLDNIGHLRTRHESVRAMLDVFTLDLSDFAPGDRASEVLYSVRTRYVTDDRDMFWHPGITTLGLDTVTGEEVDVPRDQRLMAGGASGSGKSWSTRALMARAVVHPDEQLAGFIDGKGEESTRWKGVCPCFVGDEGAIEGIESAYDAMMNRRDILLAENKSEWLASMGPRLTYVIDEGAAVVQAVEQEDKRRNRKAGRQNSEDDGPQEEGVTVMQKLERLSSQGRSRWVTLLWQTQNPLRSGDGRGITSAIRTNFDYGFCLRVNTPENTVTVLNEGSGVEPHKLPRGDRFRGHGYLNTHGPNLIRTWTVTDEMIGLLAYPDHGRGHYPRDIALKALSSRPDLTWTGDLLASVTGCGEQQANRFLRSFTQEGLMMSDGGGFRLVRS